MKKIFSILLGLILSFALIGCQSVAEPEMNTPNTENEINQPQQDIDDLKIIAKGAPVEVRLASDGQYSYEYDKDEYTVTTVTNDSTFEIKVTDNQPEADSENQNHVIVSIPNQSYSLIKGVFEGSSLILPAMNTNITVTSTASSVAMKLPSDYNKTLNYTGNASSCALSISNINDFAINAKISSSSFLVPSDWPAYDMLGSNYDYTRGKGTAKMNIDVTSSSFAFSNE